MGWRYVVVLGAAAIGILLAGVLAIALVGRLWVRYGLGVGLIVLSGVLLLIGWLMDRKSKRVRAGLDRV